MDLLTKDTPVYDNANVGDILCLYNVSFGPSSPWLQFEQPALFIVEEKATDGGYKVRHLASRIQLATKTEVTDVSAYLYRAEAVYRHLQHKAKAKEDYLNKHLTKVTTERNLLVQILSNQGMRIVTEEQAKSLGITNTSPNKRTE